MNLTIVILLLLVLLASLVLSILLLLDRPRIREEHLNFADGVGDSESRSGGTEEAPVSIHEACKTGNMRELNQWLSLGTDLNQKDEDGDAPLHHACEN